MVGTIQIKKSFYGLEEMIVKTIASDFSVFDSFRHDVYTKLSDYNKYIYMSWFVMNELSKTADTVDAKLMQRLYSYYLEVSSTCPIERMYYEGLPIQCVIMMEMLRSYMIGHNAYVRQRNLDTMKSEE